MLSFSILLAAGAPPPQGSDTITVTARPAEEVRREAQLYVKATGVAQQPVARWIDPVCPKVLGIAPKLTERVERQVRAVAERVGAKVAKPKCRSNLLIAFVKGGDAVVRRIAAKAPHQFKDVDAQHRATLYGGTAPIRWWHAIRTRTGDGMRDMGNDVPAFVQSAAPGGVPLGGDIHLQYRSSLASTQVVRALQVATVIIDVDRAEGQTLDSVTEFAALVGLAEVQPSPSLPGNSILSLFAAEGPKQLTPLDTQFLRAIYKLPLDRTAFAHRSLLVKGLTGQESE
ncbi:hypothetical protein HJG53_12055 [Sphingomonas sp. ID1715]|uniref:hypothetical protein n=1 Tax=Sphingomonas sp. ID1715 TaxID=1656898 RepID=UPI0014889497|nr:hypothetical protein [Sphingomonas sp. ID1715]NNM77642.1 hypothetical protein [Sphingomonas sp. ID1715]